MKRKINKMDLIRIKNLGGAEDSVQRLKREEVGLGGNVANRMSNEGFVSRI